MSEDPFVRWRQSNPFGIYHSGSWKWHAEDEGPWSAWYSGRVKDTLALPDDSLLVAVESGGVWRTNADGTPAICVSNDWPAHRFNRLAQGPDGIDHAFAGGESLWVTDPKDPLPFLAWQQITSFTFGSVWDVLVLGRTIVVAADGGIWWSDIPQPVARKGCLAAFLGPSTPAAASYSWRRALVDTPSGTEPSQAFFNLAEGHPDRSANRERYWTIIAGAAGMNATEQRGIFVGSWNTNGDLVFAKSVLVTDPPRLEVAGDIAVASCAWNPERAYAAADKDDKLDLLMRSDDGGRTWRPMGAKLLLDTTIDLLAKCNHQAGHQTLSVAPNDPDVVAFGWFDSYVSFDGGQTWDAPGVNDNVNSYDNKHLHADIHRVRLLQPAEAAPSMVPQRTFASGDGGIASLEWGQGATFIEGPFMSDGDHGNLEAVVLEGNRLVHYDRPSDTLEWNEVGVVTEKATGRGCIIQSDFNSADERNYEVVLQEGSDLVHYWRDHRRGEWHKSRVVSASATGPATFIQSDYPIRLPDGFIHGNFEAVVLEGSELFHYWRDNSDPASAWHRTSTPITVHAASWGCIIQSDYPRGADHGNFEVVVLEDEGGMFGRALVHYWRDNAGDQDWHGPYLITKAATGPAWFFQSDYPRGADHCNFELFMQEGKELAHWIRDNQAPGTPWRRATTITAPNDFVSGSPCAFQGNYGSDEHHGNFELIAPTGTRLHHYFRDDGRDGLPWIKDDMITHHAAHFRSGWNRSLPTLMFNRYVWVGDGHGGFGVSEVVSGMEAGGLQDLGNVTAISVSSSSAATPWVQLGGGDGHEATFPAASSPVSSFLPTGRLQVWYDNRDGIPKAWTGDPASGTLDPAATPDIIPLTDPDPSLQPPPPPADGLKGDPRLGRVTSPQFSRNNEFLVLLASPGIPGGSRRGVIYGLFSDEPPDDRAGAQPIRAGWQFLGALSVASGKDESWPIISLCAASGRTVYLCALTTNPITRTTSFQLFALDIASQNVTAMPVDSALRGVQVDLIEAASDTEVYGATNDGRVIVWDGRSWTQPGALVAGGVALVGLAVDAGVRPSAVFVATGSDVYVSRDGARSWNPATKGLPRSLEPSGLALVASDRTAALHMSTYGRSTWVADDVRPH